VYTNLEGETKIYLDGKEVGRVKGSGEVKVAVAPGRHTVDAVFPDGFKMRKTYPPGNIVFKYISKSPGKPAARKLYLKLKGSRVRVRIYVDPPWRYAGSTSDWRMYTDEDLARMAKASLKVVEAQCPGTVVIDGVSEGVHTLVIVVPGHALKAGRLTYYPAFALANKYFKNGSAVSIKYDPSVKAICKINRIVRAEGGGPAPPGTGAVRVVAKSREKAGKVKVVVKAEEKDPATKKPVEKTIAVETPGTPEEPEKCVVCAPKRGEVKVIVIDTETGKETEIASSGSYVVTDTGDGVAQEVTAEGEVSIDKTSRLATTSLLGAIIPLYIVLVEHLNVEEKWKKMLILAAIVIAALVCLWLEGWI